MDLVNLDDIRRAAAAIDGLALRTPLLSATWTEALWLKPENLQPVGAFKIRGAGYAVSRLGRTEGVITHSSGNHGRALGHVARVRGIGCVVVVPAEAPAVKVAAMRDTGAELVVVPGALREETALELARDRKLTLVPPYDHPDVIAGQGTVGLEILQDLDGVDTVLVPVGGGGLASGVGAAVKALSPSTRIVGVEPELAADAAEGLRTGVRASWPVADRYRTIADGVRVELSDLTFAHISAYVDDIVTVTEAEIRDAVGLLARRARLVAEPSGALTVAAHRRHGAGFGKTVAVISGGNIEPALLSELVRD